MAEDVINNKFELYELDWDSKFFGVTCAKAILYEPLSLADWDILKGKFYQYQFVSIVNRNSEPSNAQLVGRETSAFLADINVQFVKMLDERVGSPKAVETYQGMMRDDRLLEIVEFPFSKFVVDPELRKRGGKLVHQQWIVNSFGKDDKYFAVSKDDSNGAPDGFALHSYNGDVCLIELIAVSKNKKKLGIGTKLFMAIESAARHRGCTKIRVGTQVRNISAMNFYHKVGCKQVECHEVYHLWNI